MTARHRDRSDRRNRKLLEWVEHWTAILQPDRGPLVRRLRGGVRRALPAASSQSGTFDAARPRRSGRTASTPAATPATSPGSRTARSSAASARPTPARRTTGATRPRCAPRCCASTRARCAAARCTSCRSRWARSVRRSRTSASSSPTPRTSPSSMRTMTRMGKAALDVLGADGEFVPCVHSVGMPLEPGQADVPWPCNNDRQVHRALPRDARDPVVRLGLRRQRAARQEVLRAAHRVASWRATRAGSPSTCSSSSSRTRRARSRYVAAAFPSACGKTNLAMLVPTLPGLEGRDDRRRHLLDEVRRRRPAATRSTPSTACSASRPVPASTRTRTRSPRSRATPCSPTSRCTDDGDVWWEGLTDEQARAPHRLAAATTGRPRPTSPPPTRTAASPRRSSQVPSRRARVGRPERRADLGDPVRRPPRARTVPLVTEAYNWRHGVFLGSIMGSETTAAAAGAVGNLRRDPFAMLPFCGYHMGDYFAHWLRDRRAGRRRRSCRSSSTSTGSARTPTASSSGPATARTAACSRGCSTAAPATPTRATPRSAGCPTPARSRPTASTLAPGALDELLVGRRRRRGGPSCRSSRSTTRMFGDRLPPTLRDELDALAKRLAEHAERSRRDGHPRLDRRRLRRRRARPRGHRRRRRWNLGCLGTIVVGVARRPASAAGSSAWPATRASATSACARCSSRSSARSCSCVIVGLLTGRRHRQY